MLNDMISPEYGRKRITGMQKQKTQNVEVRMKKQISECRF
jgi:hypothetical protein